MIDPEVDGILVREVIGHNKSISSISGNIRTGIVTSSRIGFEVRVWCP